MSHNQVQYKSAEVDSVNVFYREAGAAHLPGLLLLHGHASSSHTFRNIILGLSDSFHVIAPDYPGFGNSDMPDPKSYEYSFVHVSDTIDKFTEQIGLKTFFVYIFDYGAPVGLTMAAKHPERILGIFTQSGNAYEEGLSPAFDGLRAWWADASQDDVPKHIFSPEGIDWAYQTGVPAGTVGPDAANLDKFYTHRPGGLEVQLLMLRDYENNIKKYPEWQRYLRTHQPKIVGIWGSDDPFFTPPGAEAFKRDVPSADITIIDACHFLNESHSQVIIEGVKKLL
jgi:pimeloyl-ACP methyl ester carboxylesterase